MSRNRRFIGTIVVFSAFALAVPAGNALAQGHGQAKKAEKAGKAEHKADPKDDHKAAPRDDHKTDHRDDHGRAVVVDRDGHVRIIREYALAGSLPPGLAKHGALPPGLRKQLRERGELPPGLQKRLVPVPGPLVTRLPAVPPYYQRYFAGDDLVVVDTRTSRIAAIIRDVWR